MNYVSKKIKGVTNWIVSHPEVTEPNMAEMMSLLCDVSCQSGKMREQSLKDFSEMYAARFGHSKCPNRSNTAMWRLFRAVANKVIVDGISVEDKELLVLLMSVGNFVAQGNKWDNPYEEARIAELSDSYEGQFKELIEEALDEANAAKA